MQSLAIGPSADTTSPAQNSGLSSLKSADFFRMLVSELKQQNPFEPTKTSDMISQVSQIRSIELSGQLTDTLDRLTRQQGVNGVSELIGKYVVASVAGPDGTPTAVEGVVTSIRFGSDGVAVLELDTGESVRAMDVAWVTTLENVERLGTLDAEETPEEAEDQAGAKSEATARRRAAPRGPAWFSLDAAVRP